MMTIGDWHRIMQPGAGIRAIPDPRLSLRVGPAGARIDGQASFCAYQEHARLVTALSAGCPRVLVGELGDIVRMPLGNHPERGLTCES